MHNFATPLIRYEIMDYVEMDFTRHDGPILRGRNGKYEDFVSEL